MKKLVVTLALAALLAVTAVAAAATPKPVGTKCPKANGYNGIYVHQLSCRAAYKALRNGEKGFKCNTPKRVPALVTCRQNGHRTHFFDYVVFGG